MNNYKYEVPKVVAEVGCNHKGDLSIAKEMVRIAASYCNVDFVKFQKRDNRLLLSKEEYNSPHPCPENSYGATYGEHREILEFTIEQHYELKACCEEFGVGYACSVWDINSAVAIAKLNPWIIKIPSAQNTNTGILTWLLTHFRGKIHISLGMTNLEELKEIYNLVSKKNRLDDIVFYSCTSGYPVDSKDICLLEIIKIKDGLNLDSIGFSGHHLGIAPDIAAYTLGASWIERHFTLNRAWKGTDHAASLEKDGLRKLKRDLVAVSKSLTFKKEEILEVEKKQREKLKFK